LTRGGNWELRRVNKMEALGLAERAKKRTEGGVDKKQLQCQHILKRTSGGIGGGGGGREVYRYEETWTPPE